MEITNIHIRKINENEKMRAIVSVTFDNMFVVHDIKVIAGADRTFVAMPSRKAFDGRFADVAHPINQEFRDVLERSILDTYYDELEKYQEQAENQPEE